MMRNELTSGLARAAIANGRKKARVRSETEPAAPLDDDETKKREKKLRKKKNDTDLGRNGKKKNDKMKKEKKMKAKPKVTQAMIDTRIERLEKKARAVEMSDVDPKLRAIAAIATSQYQPKRLQQEESPVDVFDPVEAGVEQSVVDMISKVGMSASGQKIMVRAMKKASRMTKGAA